MLRWKSSLKPTSGGGGGGGGSYTLEETFADDSANEYNWSKAASTTYVGTLVAPASSYTATRLEFYLKKTGTGGGTITAEIWSATGSAGSETPNALLATSTTTVAASGVSATKGFVAFDFAGQALASGTKYFFVMKTPTPGDGSNYYNLTLGSSYNTTNFETVKADATPTWSEANGGRGGYCRSYSGGGGGSFLFTETFEGSESDNQGTSGYDNTGWTTVVSQASNVANPNYTPALADAASYQLKQQSTAPYTDDSAVNSFTASANIYMYFIWKMPYMSAVFDAKIKIQDASGNQLVAIGPHYDSLQLKDNGTNTATLSSSVPVKDDVIHFWIDRIAGTSIELRYASNATRPSSAALTISSPSGSADAAKVLLKAGHPSLGLGVYDNLVMNTSSIGSNPLAGGGATFPSTSLVGFYKLGEASGADALDSSGNSHTFSDNGTVASTTGTIGGETVNVRTLDRPAGKYFSLADDADFDVGDGEDFTIAFWAKLSSSMTNFATGGVFSKRNAVGASDAGYSIDLRRFNSDVYIRYNGVSDGTTTIGDSNADTGIATDAWAHYMMVLTADATLITYVNNAQYSSVDASSVTGSLANSMPNYIGQRAYNSNGDIIADVTHVGFWKKALDSSERTALYNSGKVLAPSSGGSTAITLENEAYKLNQTGYNAPRNLTFTTPAVQANDILLLIVSSESACQVGTANAGWNLIVNNQGSSAHLGAVFAYWKRATGAASETDETFGDSTTEFFNARESTYSWCGAYSGCATSGSPISAYGEAEVGYSTEYNVDVTPTVANTMVVAAMTNGTNSGYTFSWDDGTTLVTGQHYYGAGFVSINEKLETSSGSAVTRSGSLSGPSGGPIIAVALKPA